MTSRLLDVLKLKIMRKKKIKSSEIKSKETGAEKTDLDIEKYDFKYLKGREKEILESEMPSKLPKKIRSGTKESYRPLHRK